MCKRFAKTKQLIALALTLPLFSISACSSLEHMVGELPLYEEEANIVGLNYAASDVVATQLNKSLNANKPIIVQDFWNHNAPHYMAPFGRVLPEQLSTRLIQLGFKIIQPRYASPQAPSVTPTQQYPEYTQSSELILTGEQQSQDMVQKYRRGPHIVFSGSYTKSTDHVKVSVRLTDSQSGAFIAAHDYSIPLTREVEQLIALPRQSRL